MGGRRTSCGARSATCCRRRSATGAPPARAPSARRDRGRNGALAGAQPRALGKGVSRLSVRVLFLTTEWPSPAVPANGIFVREHAYAAATCCDVAVVNVDRSRGRRGLFELERLDEELPAVRVRYRRFPRPLSYAAFGLGAVAAVRRLRREGFEPDVLHANSFLSA